MREALLASLPKTTQFYQLRQTVWLLGDAALYTSEKIRELICTTAALQDEANSEFGIGALMSTKHKGANISATRKRQPEWWQQRI
ncbi:hypothetical protein KXD40_004955 [Peronospora effusa]|uniref:Uncharacterized protein n=1 Tax=Peronospora effusa TaxID=542832 RepID=A0A3M6VG05_9STRA|nr:hypothetical protein DD238_005559 [Peronospora effusa]RQM14581.1 hypothetical protein DD237_006014 [Peronospora effusa]UIZ22175.1 hypothetical protein KXD40_004955 [Peronospora effusa]CAI5708183.1 unnamed protein product [Peronospora effusa]